MSEYKPLPVGVDNFEKLITDGYYFVDKTLLIKELLDKKGEVNLFTRPRRFGKTLNISMLQYFFEDARENDGRKRDNRSLFEGLRIMEEGEKYLSKFGKYPVISLSLKSAKQPNFEEAYMALRTEIAGEFKRHSFIAEHECLFPDEKELFLKLMLQKGEKAEYNQSLKFLSSCMKKYYGKKAMILIDEYDVPLENSFFRGFYEEMADFLRSLFESALKTNSSLEFAVLTGCLRISKESIFTGMNNLKIISILSDKYDEHFGFTDAEVRQMLEYYGFSGQYDSVKEWYDGYMFGNLGIYCPWDVINYCGDLRDGSVTEPQNYWVNTSSNDIIRRFLSRADATTRDEIELLINGGHVKKMVHQELTYRDLDSDIDNLWSILFTTGYLTQDEEDEEGISSLVIPNREILWIYVQQIRKWFKDESRKDTQKLENLRRAFEENNTAAIEKEFAFYLRKTISIRDTNVKKEMKENFYHGVLLGLFGNIDGWKVKSNAESGDGYSDISVEVEDQEIGIVIELKYAENAAFDSACKEALKQIYDNNYEEVLADNGMKTIYKYGIACYKKRCKVVSK